MHSNKQHGYVQRGVYLQDLESVAGGGPAHIDGPVKAPWPDEGIIQGVYPVGGPYHQHLVIALEAIHLAQQLQQPLLPLCCATV